MTRIRSGLSFKIRSLNGRDYGACQDLLGEYDFQNKFKLIIHKIPKDPYAPPHTGVYRIQVSRSNKQIINVFIHMNRYNLIHTVSQISLGYKRTQRRVKFR